MLLWNPSIMCSHDNLMTIEPLSTSNPGDFTFHATLMKPGHTLRCPDNDIGPMKNPKSPIIEPECYDETFSWDQEDSLVLGEPRLSEACSW